jgi:hypothetical protein
LSLFHFHRLQGCRFPARTTLPDCVVQAGVRSDGESYSRSKIPLRTKVWSGIVSKRGLSASGGLAEQNPAADEGLERDCF